MPSTRPAGRERLSAWITPATLAVGAGGGIGYALVALWVYSSVRRQSIPQLFEFSEPAGALWAAYVLVGLVLSGGIALVLLVRRNLLLPVTALFATFSWASYRTWQSLEAAREAGAVPGLTLRLDTTVLLFWFLPLGGALLLGAVEDALRSRVGETG